MTLCVACFAALIAPITTPVNLIAMGAAGYRFVVMTVFFVVGVFVVPVFSSF